jgi:hypothetical protein
MVKAIGDTAGHQIDVTYTDSDDAASAHSEFASATALVRCQQRWRQRCHDDVVAIVNAGCGVIATATGYADTDAETARELRRLGR